MVPSMQRSTGLYPETLTLQFISILPPKLVANQEAVNPLRGTISLMKIPRLSKPVSLMLFRLATPYLVPKVWEQHAHHAHVLT